jgi:hypothetical protein
VKLTYNIIPYVLEQKVIPPTKPNTTACISGDGFTLSVVASKIHAIPAPIGKGRELSAPNKKALIREPV